VRERPLGNGEKKEKGNPSKSKKTMGRFIKQAKKKLKRFLRGGKVPR